MDGSFCRIDAIHAGLDSDIYARLLEILRSSNDESLIVFDYITDVIGHRSGRIRDEFTLLDHCDL